MPTPRMNKTEEEEAAQVRRLLAFVRARESDFQTIKAIIVCPAKALKWACKAFKKADLYPLLKITAEEMTWTAMTSHI